MSDVIATPSPTSGRRYHVHEVLGRGGFGTVYRAELLSAGGFSKWVALKVLNDDLGRRPEIVQRLRDEARVLGLLRHRAIVQVDDLIELGGRWAVVMEYVEGVTLAELIASVEVPPRVAVEIAEEVAGALFAAYEQPSRGGRPLALLHRDIKPSNLQITPGGEVKLLDFGIARASFDGREAQTRAVMMGSRPYMSPDRLDLEDTHGGDVYALAISLCEAITGEHPEPTTIHPERHAAHSAALLASVRARVDDEPLLALLADCLQYEVEDRPTARELERRLRQVRANLKGPWLRDWAEQAVMPALSARELSRDGLSGEVLQGVLGTGGAEPTLAPPLTEPPAPSAAPPPARSSLRRWILGAVAALGLTTVLAVLASSGVLVALFAWFWSLVLRESVDSSLSDSLTMIEALSEQPNKAFLRDKIVIVKTAPARANLGLWEITTWNLELEEALADDVLTDTERTLLLRGLDARLAD